MTKAKQSLAGLLVLLCLAMALQSCSAKPSASDAALQSVLNQRIASNDPAEAYYLAFLYLRQLQGTGQVIGLDLSECKLQDTTSLVANIEAYCATNNKTLVLGTLDELGAQGYVQPDGHGNWQDFKDGALYSFKDISLSKTKLITNATVWYGNLGANGAELTMQCTKGTWQITNRTNQWIS